MKSKYLNRELEILMSLDHPNIVKFISIFKNNEHIYFVMELIKGGNIENYFKKLDAK
jgi:serine/threonine protein kinase